jgi:hypothetical protein
MMGYMMAFSKAWYVQGLYLEDVAAPAGPKAQLITSSVTTLKGERITSKAHIKNGTCVAT